MVSGSFHLCTSPSSSSPFSSSLSLLALLTPPQRQLILCRFHSPWPPSIGFTFRLANSAFSFVNMHGLQRGMCHYSTWISGIVPIKLRMSRLFAEYNGVIPYNVIKESRFGITFSSKRCLMGLRNDKLSPRSKGDRHIFCATSVLDKRSAHGI